MVGCGSSIQRHGTSPPSWIRREWAAGDCASDGHRGCLHRDGVKRRVQLSGFMKRPLSCTQAGRSSSRRVASARCASRASFTSSRPMRTRSSCMQYGLLAGARQTRLFQRSSCHATRIVRCRRIEMAPMTIRPRTAGSRRRAFGRRGRSRRDAGAPPRGCSPWTSLYQLGSNTYSYQVPGTMPHLLVSNKPSREIDLVYFGSESKMPWLRTTG